MSTFGEMCVFLLLFIVAGTAATELTGEEYSRLPKLFHLDDYERCLSQENGLYCLGTFHLTPTHQPHPTYELMKEYITNPYTFNRTLLRRGYCVSARCPSSAAERNATLRFERCAAARARPLALRTSLRTLHYCRTHRDAQDRPSTPEQKLFMKIVYTILALNVVGTVYDVFTGNNAKKNALLTAWSIPANWNRLIAVNVDGDPRLTAFTPFQGVRVVGLSAIIYAHANVFHFSFYTSNPEYLEKLTVSSNGIVLSNGTALVHVFTIISSILTAYSLLLYSEKTPLNLNMLPSCIIKRYFRTMPVHLLVVGYAATWWPYARDGPLVSSTIGENSKICRNKFWTHALLLHNIVNKEDICITPTWYLAVDMHLYILTCFLTIIMWRYRRQAIAIYGVLFFSTCYLNGVISYANNWKSLLYISTPENVRTVFRGSESFSHFYTSTWGALPACFLGLFIGHLHYELMKDGFKYIDNKWLAVFHTISLPVGIQWVIRAGKFSQSYPSSTFTAAFIGIDRAVFFILIAGHAYTMIVVDGPIRRLYAWRGWHSMGRMSLSVMLLHWCVNMVIAARPVVYHTSGLDVLVDWLATLVITFLLAVPTTVLVETPFQRTISALL